jgi:transketolase
MTDDMRNLEYHAARCRRNVVRMVRSGGAGYMGGAMSCLDILTALYFHALNVDPANPGKPDRDRFVLSAGHKAMALYAVLAERGFFEEDLLDTYGKLGSRLPRNPDMHKLSGVEANTGALGHGLPIAVGMALGLHDSGLKSRVFVLLGDGELAEGSNWEAASAASHYGLDNLTVFVDDNGLQTGGRSEDIMSMEPVELRFDAFGWATKVINGNDMAEIVETLDLLPLERGHPSAIIAHTVKGHGISFAQDSVAHHYWKPDEDELSSAEHELDEALRERRGL